MRKYLAKALAWLKAYREQEVKQSKLQRLLQLKAEARDLIQLKEFGGTAWISVDNVPLLEYADVKQDLLDTVENMRAAYVDYKSDYEGLDILPDIHGAH